MFEPTDIAAVLIKFAIFMQLFSAYPLLNHFQRTILMNLLMPNIDKLEDIPKVKFFYLNATISIFPLIFALFYPDIGFFALKQISKLPDFHKQQSIQVSKQKRKSKRTMNLYFSED